MLMVDCWFCTLEVKAVFCFQIVTLSIAKPSLPDQVDSLEPTEPSQPDLNLNLTSTVSPANRDRSNAPKSSSVKLPQPY